MRQLGVWTSATALFVGMGLTGEARAQALGAYKWQLQPYCNVVTLTVTQVDGVYRLDGTDDQCGNGADQASAMGTAFPNPDGTIGFGLTIVASPGGAPVHVDAALAAGGFDGTWKDSAGNGGTFKFTPAAATGGSPRPAPKNQVPPAIQLRVDGGLLAAGGTGQIPAQGPGTRMMWHSGKGAFRAGNALGTSWDDANVGQFSAAFGNGATASGLGSFATGTAVASGASSVALVAGRALGDSSFAAGRTAEATGVASVALGNASRANGIYAFAAGNFTEASGGVSTALGDRTRATGGASTALGYQTVASGRVSLAGGEQATAQGEYSVALGYKTAALGKSSVVIGANAETTSAAPGSFVFGDSSPPTVPGLQSYAPNEFVARFAGGYVFFSNNTLTSGVYVAPGANAWASLSDVNAKENFRDLDADEVLAKIAAMPVREWNYKSQDAAIRHLGPTAQDFRAAFGLGEDPLRISTIDADGVALAAVKALEARTRRLMEDKAALQARIEALEGAGHRAASADFPRHGAVVRTASTRGPAGATPANPSSHDWIVGALAALVAALACLFRASGSPA